MKRFIVIIIIIVLILAVLYVFKDQINWQSSYEQVNPTTQGTLPTTPVGSGSNGQNNIVDKEEAPSDVVYVADHFAELAADFDTDTPFRINGIWFQGGTMFYVDYENAKNMESQVLVVKESGSFIGKGYFAPGEAGWVLQAGEGELMQANAVFYEKDASGIWIRKN